MKITRQRKLLALVAVLAALAIACGGTSSGGQAQDLAATQQSLQSTQNALAALSQVTTQAPLPTRTPAPTQSPYYREEFDSDLDDWLEFYLTDTEGDYYLEDSNLKMTLEEEDTFLYLINDSYSYSDVRLDVEVRNLGANKNWLSLVCRESDIGWYEFNVGNDGYYLILHYDAVADIFRELYSGGSTAINTGKETNEFTVICDGDKLSLYINGVETRTVTNSVLTEGHIGISGSSYDVVPVVMWFNWLEVSAP